ncbi:MFS multidrug transporter [Cordyceps javanica]|uniref:MFS multidrug transporter n=1 Tax=Cordyceps javanica TaxID=43265 RepID=A0A545V4Q4_9HYPO|nr:MFS multidrug transporter [Cordyceps javanica]
MDLWICLFLSALETTIVSTALRSMSSDLKGLSQSTWVVVAYLLTYNGKYTASFQCCLISPRILQTDRHIRSKESTDTVATDFSRLFNGLRGCPDHDTTVRIVFRALQGIGASGIYSIVFVIIGKIGSVEKMPLYMGAITSVFALASLIGPILGGIIVNHTTCGPGVALSLLLLIPSIPDLGEKLMDREKLKQVDVIGGILSLVWPTLLVFALEQGGQAYPWQSSIIIGTLVGSVIGFFSFGFYEIRVQRLGKQEPIVEYSFLLVRVMFTMGGCFYAAIFLLPQRFQAVNGISAQRAGINLLPFTIVSPVFSVLCGMLLAKVQKVATMVLVVSSVCTVIGIIMLGTLSSSPQVFELKTYGFEVILALAAIMGANNTARTLGGCVAVAISSSILHADLVPSLRSFLSPNQVEAILTSTLGGPELTWSEKIKVQEAYGKCYNMQFRALIAFAGANLICCLALSIVRYSIERRHKQNVRPSNAALEIGSGQ